MELYFYLFAGLSTVIFIVCFFLYLRLSSLIKKYQRFMADNKGFSSEEKLAALQKEMQALREEARLNQEEILRISKNLEKSIRGYSVVRFNAFEHAGGNLSFAVALLDGRKNGVVLSSIYGREEQRVYVKPIIAASSTYALSAEENEAINQAVKMLVSK